MPESVAGKQEILFSETFSETYHGDIKEATMKRNRKYKEPPPRGLTTTELGSAVFASIEGRPPDKDYLVKGKSSKGSSPDEDRDGAGDFKENKE
jgi:hypothetical protein